MSINSETTPWNKGKLVGQKLPLKLIWAIRVRLQLAGNRRDLALFNLAIDSKLRGSDLVKIRVNDISNSGVISSQAMILQQKTTQPVQFEIKITEGTRESITDWLSVCGAAGSDYLFPSRISSSPHLSTRQYARIVERWVSEIGLDAGLYDTHSLRRTKPTLIYKRTRNLRAVQLLLGHTKLESAVRYLCVEVDDALEIAGQTEI